jgi:CRP/FNR family cyclic AMP-dependent transcriptional regulator
MTSDSPIELSTFRSLAHGRDLRPMHRGEVIFSAGDQGDCLYGVVEGSVRLEWDEGRQSETVGPGSSFGVGALVDNANHRRFGTATALSDGALLEMNREQFLLALQELPMFALEVLHDLDERHRDLKSRTRTLGVDRTTD